MCGICGLWQAAGFEEERVRAMNAALIHRGPDDEGYFFQGPVGLGHRRLSIIDLQKGRQPLSNGPGPNVSLTIEGMRFGGAGRGLTVPPWGKFGLNTNSRDKESRESWR